MSATSHFGRNALIGFFFALFSALLVAQELQPDTAPGQTKKPDAILSGLVVSSVGAAPVRKASVQVMSESQQSQGERETTSTDAQGRFSFTGLPVGKYRLFVSHPGYVESARQSGRTQSSYTLAAGQEIKDVVIRLVPAAVVRGRISDQDGDPVARIQVEVISASKPRYGGAGNRGVVASGATDDLGEFRIFSVPPGRYYVKAALSMEMRAPPGRSEKQEQEANMPTFYPGATRREAATVLDVHGGDELVVNIALQRGALYPVTGMLRNAKGGLVSRGMVMAMQSSYDSARGEVSAGKFELRLPAGIYSLLGIGLDEIISGGAGFGFGSNNGPPQGHMRIDVPEGGLRDVEIVLSPEKGPGVRVGGRVRIEGGGALPEGKTLLVALQPAESRFSQTDDDEVIFTTRAQGGFSATKPDGSFEMKEVPAGSYEVALSASSTGLEDWYTKAVFVGNRDVLNSGVTVADADLQLDILVSPKGGSIEGMVKDKEKEDHPATNARVVVVPDVARAKRQSLYETAATDQNGRFLLQGLEPGSYTVYAFEEGDAGVWFNVEAMKQYKDDGVSVAVHAAEKAHADLHLAVNHEEHDAQ